MRSEHEIFALLTPEQKKQLEEHRPKPHDGKDGKDGHPPA
jgi:Spy/CpxP family protein refolding chaperone